MKKLDTFRTSSSGKYYIKIGNYWYEAVNDPQKLGYDYTVKKDSMGMADNLFQISWNTGLSSYSSGIENGPVTYTGLAMLHGTPSSPEYVLNSD